MHEIITDSTLEFWLMNWDPFQGPAPRGVYIARARFRSLVG